MNIGIVGLGLIGGSIAKAYKKYSDAKVFGFDIDKQSLSYAKLSETIDETLTDDVLLECDLVFISLYPKEAIEFLKEKANLFKKDALVMDTCGVKQELCELGFSLAKEHGFVFVGGHPMAGIQFSGIKFSDADLFKGASMVVVPPAFDDIYLLDRIRSSLKPLNFGKYSLCTAQKHDKIIAYTSQLAHIVSNAYVKSEAAQEHHGFSAGSYKDMTRVAILNEDMWTYLFMHNKENLSLEISELITSLTKYKEALDAGDEQLLYNLLKEGRERKERADG